MAVPFPKPDDPAYCPGSNAVCKDYDEEHRWFRCPECGRLLKPRPVRHTFHPHVNDRSRAKTSDRVREGLDAMGYNRRRMWAG